ncbi:MAG: rane protein [Marmoricola sp.]|nr:rane protein [Marmoricola sp.]
MGERKLGWRVFTQPVPAALLIAITLHLIWLLLVANGGGDLAAQDAWAEFARAHPRMAYDLAWYGGMHPVSYSVLSPYVMGYLGVRSTMVFVGVVSSGLLAHLIVRTGAVRRPLLPAVYGAFALAGNAFSGRVTFGLGIMFALAAVTVVFDPRLGTERPITTRLRWRRAATAALLSFLATASSPVAGLFLGVVAGALWLSGRRRIASAMGLPPILVVALSALLFPFSGEQPMDAQSAVLPVIIGVCCMLLAPSTWRTVRFGSALYALGVIAVLVVPSEIGSNVTRLALIFGGVVLVAIATQTKPPSILRPVSSLSSRSAARYALAAAMIAATVWQVGTATADVVNTRSASTWTANVGPLVAQLRARHADEARVEVVPTRSHREASVLAPYVNMARGWNRQADRERNPLFYVDTPLTASAYRQWLDRWAVHYVFLADGETDPAATEEASLITHGLAYLSPVWTGAGGRLYAVKSPAPLADGSAKVVHFDASQVVVDVTKPGDFRLRILASPWLSLLYPDGKVIPAPQSDNPAVAPVDVEGCLGKSVQPVEPNGKEYWTVLEAPHPGVYTIATPYNLPRGTACPTPGG